MTEKGDCSASSPRALSAAATFSAVVGSAAGLAQGEPWCGSGSRTLPRAAGAGRAKDQTRSQAGVGFCRSQARWLSSDCGEDRRCNFLWCLSFHCRNRASSVLHRQDRCNFGFGDLVGGVLLAIVSTSLPIFFGSTLFFGSGPIKLSLLRLELLSATTAAFRLSLNLALSSFCAAESRLGLGRIFPGTVFLGVRFDLYTSGPGSFCSVHALSGSRLLSVLSVDLLCTPARRLRPLGRFRVPISTFPLRRKSPNPERIPPNAKSSAQRHHGTFSSFTCTFLARPTPCFPRFVPAHHPGALPRLSHAGATVVNVICMASRTSIMVCSARAAARREPSFRISIA